MEFLDRVLWEPIACTAAIIIDKRAGLIGRAMRRLFRQVPEPVDVDLGTAQGAAGSAAMAVDVVPVIAEGTAATVAFRVGAPDAD